MANQYEKVAIGDIGTQVFWWNPKHSGTGTESDPYKGSFEYAVPVTAGAEFGGDTESFDAPETDLDYIPKIGGRTSINDISYTINYTADKYQRLLDISNNTDMNIYMEVFSDGSSAIYQGTSGMPTITAGDVRQINWTVIASALVVVSNIFNLTTKDIERLGLIDADVYTGKAINIDATTIPTARQDYAVSKGSKA